MNKQVFPRLIVMGVCLTVLTTSGCQSLRKKFTREPKKDKQEKFIPLLDPIEYAPAQVNPQERYAYHYSLWRVWERDLYNSLSETTNTKRLRGILAEMVVHLDEMQRWITADKQQELQALTDELRSLEDELDKPGQNDYVLKKRLRLNAKAVRDSFHPDKVTDYIVTL